MVVVCFSCRNFRHDEVMMDDDVEHNAMRCDEMIYASFYG